MMVNIIPAKYQPFSIMYSMLSLAYSTIYRCTYRCSLTSTKVSLIKYFHLGFYRNINILFSGNKTSPNFTQIGFEFN